MSEESGFEVFMEYGPIVFAGPIVLASQREEFWHSYVVYPEEVHWPNPAFWIFVGDAVKDWADQWRDRWEWGWYAPIVEESPPEPPPRPTIGEIWGRERWGK